MMINKENLYIVILAGGKGERLWPLSREKKPKQLLPVNDELSLLEQTITRVNKLVPLSNLYIMTTEQQAEIIEKLVGNTVGCVLKEPCSRNTGPALLLTCMHIMKKDKDATICFLPADHFITDATEFANKISQALYFSAQEMVFTLLGIKPTFPATGYGYIEYENADDNVDKQPFKVVRFHEKPSLQTAQLYTTLPNMLWNIGVFCGKASLFISEFKKNSPDVFNAISLYFEGKGNYANSPSISFDHAVLEKSEKIEVIPAAFAWSDVGNLDIFLSLRSTYQSEKQKLININSTNNIVEVPKKVVALIGIENLCIVETDDVLLISQRKQTDDVKLVLSKLKEEKKVELL